MVDTEVMVDAEVMVDIKVMVAADGRGSGRTSTPRPSSSSRADRRSSASRRRRGARGRAGGRAARRDGPRPAAGGVLLAGNTAREAEPAANGPAPCRRGGGRRPYSVAAGALGCPVPALRGGARPGSATPDGQVVSVGSAAHNPVMVLAHDVVQPSVRCEPERAWAEGRAASSRPASGRPLRPGRLPQLRLRRADSACPDGYGVVRTAAGPGQGCRAVPRWLTAPRPTVVGRSASPPWMLVFSP